MKKRSLLSTLLLAFLAVGSSAQGRHGLRINEVMVENDTSIVDEYGLHNGWIELFNSTFAPMEISSVFLTDDKEQPKKYPVPLGDARTAMAKRQHVVFWADGSPDKGTFHLNFTLKAGEENRLYLFDADGKTPIDSVTVPASLCADCSWARTEDGGEAWKLRDGTAEKYITPGGHNLIKDTNKKVDMFAEKDRNGYGLTILAMCIVFSALIVLSLCFYAISKIGEAAARQNKLKAHGKAVVEKIKGEVVDRFKEETVEHDSGEEIAAITMALHQFLSEHDQENTVLTINKVKRAYSPWSSKIYGLRETPRR